ncbi:MAG TPA: PIG-L family deacetylase [Terriglobales bacterium]|nr:PIG-L family deacetylase [Terriglobales bacterium]
MRKTTLAIRPRQSWLGPITSGFILLTFSFLLAVAQPAQGPVAPASAVQPLPQDTGITGLKLMLRRLGTTARLMQTVAHPDDEDGGMLTLESRGDGRSVQLLTLNRGEGGQNKLGSNLFDVLGVLRTLELTAADRYYGVEQHFTRVADFGYSKVADETFQKWQGHDIPLGDMVRVIRAFRPDVLAARFSGTDRDGHGHHQASAILTQEAFRAAADPSRFPEQIKEGLRPWQAKKVYVGNVCGFLATTCPNENYTLRMNTGHVDPLLGMSYIQFALLGLKHQLSQGAGGWTVEPGDRFAYYKLVDAVVSSPRDKDGHEKDFFDGIDTTLPGLTARLGSEESKVPWLKDGLAGVQGKVGEASAAAEKSAAAATGALVNGSESLQRLMARVEESSLSAEAKDDLLLPLREKAGQFEKAIALAAGAQLSVATEVPVGATPEDAFMAVPGQTFEVTARFSSTDPQAKLRNISLDLPGRWSATVLSKEENATRFKVSVPANAQVTRPYWHRDNPETDSINKIDDPHYLTLPFPPPPIQAHAVYRIGGKDSVVRGVALVKFKNASGTVEERALAVAPAFSVMLEPGEQVIPVEDGKERAVRVSVTANSAGGASGTLRLELPPGWKSEPAQLPVSLTERGEPKDYDFKVIAGSLSEGRTQIRAVLDSGGQKYSDGYTVVTREDLDTFYYYQPATQRVSIVDVKVPRDLKVAYIMGAGDDIPTVLEQIGINVTMIPPEKLAGEDLSKYGTVVLGIRAYDTQAQVKADNRKLLDYVSGGGTLVVQYNTGPGDFNGGHYTPYPAQLGRGRVSVEDAPVEILAAADRVFHSPNQITQADFRDWVQERGLYFMTDWDSHFTPLVASHDPGEQPLKGGLLRTQYGKGTYIYTGYAFFRQLPAGVPGAIRLYVNLLNAGH